MGLLTSMLSPSNSSSIDNLTVSGVAVFKGTVTMEDTLSVSGAAHFKTTISVGGVATFGDNIYVAGTSTLSAGVTLKTTLNVEGAATLGGAATIKGILTAEAAAVFKTTILADGAVTFSDTLTVSGAAVFQAKVNVNHTAAEADDEALEIVVNAAGFGDVKAIDVDYITGATASQAEEAVILLNIDSTAAVGGQVHGLEVLTTPGNISVVGMLVGAEVSPILQLSGGFGNADTILNKAVDVTAALASGGAGNITVFVLDDETITIADAAKFEEISIQLDTGASGAGVAPTFEYSTGIGLWTSFTPIDGTNGFRQTGVIEFDAALISDWATGTGTEFLIRITRTRNSVSTLPIIDVVQIAAVTEYSWNEDGDLSVNNVTIAGTLTVSGVAIFNGSVSYNGGVTYSGGAVVKGNLLVEGTTTLSGNAVAKTAFLFEDTVTISGAAILKTTLAVEGAATLSDTLTISGKAVAKTAFLVEGATTLSGNAVAKGTLLVEGATSLVGNVVAKGTLLVEGASTFSGAAIFNTTVTISGAAVFLTTTTMVGAAVAKAAFLAESTATISGAAVFKSTVLLAQDPTLSLQAVTKQYADNNGGGLEFSILLGGM